jgi:hypothetical protein
LAQDRDGAGAIGKAIVVVFAAIGAYFFVTLVLAPAVGTAVNIYNQWQSFVHFVEHPTFGPFPIAVLAAPLVAKQRAITPAIPGIAPRGLTSGELLNFGLVFFFLLAAELFLDIILLPADEVIVPGELILDVLVLMGMMKGAK